MEEKFEYLKRHKVPFILILSILLAAIIFAVCLKVSKNMTDKAQYLEEQKQLAEMSGYLNEVDEIVNHNTETLESISLFETSIEDKLGTLYENLMVLDESVSVIETNTIEYMQEISTENETVISSLTSLSVSQQEIKEQISAVGDSITASLEEIKTADKKNFESTLDKLSDLESQLNKLAKDTGTTSKAQLT